MVCLKIDRTYIGQSIGKTCQISWETSLSMNPHVRLLVGWLVLCFVGLTSKLPMLWYLWNLTNYQCRGSFLQLTSQGPQWCLGLQVYLLIYICHYHILIISKYDKEFCVQAQSALYRLLCPSVHSFNMITSQIAYRFSENLFQ